MSLKLKIGVGMMLLAILIGVISAFVDSLLAGLVYVGSIAWMSVAFWLVLRG